MPEFTTLAERYLSIWNTTDADTRQSLVRELFTPDATYTDPLGSVRGWSGIDTFIATAQDQFAGLSFRRSGAVDGHHDIARFGWHLGPDGELPIVMGFDVIVTADDRIRGVSGFLDKDPGLIDGPVSRCGEPCGARTTRPARASRARRRRHARRETRGSFR
ncbi:nuclear transport factor 2 family protein [Prauserella oleivorans]|uniref:Nuclear transport factor 2 family protein n=1 Tax=Prauserella oleivorans TaxID=1478153 RepID=A0ABW5WBF2_9PSEU